jgi:octaprenyl-diphosphate synthase
MAFQLKDDLFDYGDAGKTGKPTGIDIRESKLTLPLIHALGQSGEKEKRRIINIVKNHGGEKKKVAEVIAFVRDSGGIDYAVRQMNLIKDEALDMLNVFPDGSYKTSLKQLVLYTTDRES